MTAVAAKPVAESIVPVSVYPIRENGNCYGFLAINNDTHKVKPIELRIGDLIVSYLASFWRNLELLKDAREASDKTQNMVEEITDLLEISRALESGEDIQSLLESIIEKCMKVMNAESASLMLLDSKNNELEFKVALGPKGKEVKPLRLPIGEGIAGWVARECKPLLIPNAYEDDRFDRSFDARTGYLTKSISSTRARSARSSIRAPACSACSRLRRGLP